MSHHRLVPCVFCALTMTSAACSSSSNSSAASGAGSSGAAQTQGREQRCRRSSSSGASGVTTSGATGTPAGSTGGTTTGTGGDTGGGASTGGSSGDGGVTVVDIVPTGLPAGADLGDFANDNDAGQLWLIYSYRDDGGVRQGGLAVIDDATNATLHDIRGPFAAVIVAHDLGKAFVGLSSGLDGGLIGEVDAIDDQTYAVQTIARAEHAFDLPTSLAYDPVQRRLYASIASNGSGYLQAADAVADQLVTTYEFPDAGASDCGFSSSTSCLESFGQIAVDWSGQKVYLLGGDQGNAYPMAGTFTLSGVDGGSLEGVLGGHEGGWATGANGVGAVDGGGVVAVGLASGQGILQFLDPSTVDLVGTPTAQDALVVGRCQPAHWVVVVAEVDSQGNTSIFAYGSMGLIPGWDPLTTFQPTTARRRSPRSAVAGTTIHTRGTPGRLAADIEFTRNLRRFARGCLTQSNTWVARSRTALEKELLARAGRCCIGRCRIRSVRPIKGCPGHRILGLDRL